MGANIRYLRRIFPVLVLLLSLAAVSARLNGYRNLPPAVSHALDSFQGPGETVWWFTMGHLFQAYPRTPAGCAVLVVANTAIWTCAGYLMWWLLARFL
jgi:hypothetical protein